MKSSPSLFSRRVLVFVPAVVVAAAVLWCEFAQADLVFSNIYDGTNFTIQASNPVALTGPLQAVTLRAVGKNGTLPNTFDGYKFDQTGTGITASGLYEVWKSDDTATPTLTLAQKVNYVLDSHFLVLDANVIMLNPADEDRNDPPDHLYDPLGGMGSYLTGTFVLKVTQNATWDFAYLVVPVGATVNLDFEIGAADVDSETVNCSFGVPEPSTVVLLAVSVFGLLLYRRRLAR
jgi:hypothetical protein